MCVCVCLCVCVCKKERGRERVLLCVCMCMCVCMSAPPLHVLARVPVCCRSAFCTSSPLWSCSWLRTPRCWTSTCPACRKSCVRQRRWERASAANSPSDPTLCSCKVGPGFHCVGSHLQSGTVARRRDFDVAVGRCVVSDSNPACSVLVRHETLSDDNARVCFRTK